MTNESTKPSDAKVRKFFADDLELQKVLDQDLGEWHYIAASSYPHKKDRDGKYSKFIEHSAYLESQAQLTEALRKLGEAEEHIRLLIQDNITLRIQLEAKDE